MVTLILATGLPAPREVVGAVLRADRRHSAPHRGAARPRSTTTARTDGRAIRDAHVPGHDRGRGARARRAPVARRAGRRAGGCRHRTLLRPRGRSRGCIDRPVADLDGAAGGAGRAGRSCTRSATSTGYYDFRHQLLRDALYGDRRGRPSCAGSTPAPPSSGRCSWARRKSTRRSTSSGRACARRPTARRWPGARAASAVTSRREAFELYGRAVANAPGRPAGGRATSPTCTTG